MSSKVMNVVRAFAVVAMSALATKVAVAQDGGDGAAAGDGSSAGAYNAVVKLEVARSPANPLMPWQSYGSYADGSGVVIGDGRVLTCAHCVTDATRICVRKHCEDSAYKGTVEFVDNDCDLALVKVDDPAFMRGVVPMKLGVTPDEQARVLAVGYPIGGDGIAFTEGVVSRIEDTCYTHAKTRLLAIQVDAAINPGNSGGPVFDIETGLICGIAFQGNKAGEALGYLIPPDVIRHFFRDIEDGVVDGFGDFLFGVECLENEAARRYCGMSEDQTGVRICFVTECLGTNSVKVGDILLDVDGYRVANNGNIRIEGNRRRSLWFPFTMRQIGEEVAVSLLRAGKVVRVQIPIRKMKICSRGFLYDRKPDYFVFGGLVFSTISFSYLQDATEKVNTKVIRERSFEGEEDVVVLGVLSHDCLEGYFSLRGAVVKNVNGEKVKNLRHLVGLIEGCRDEFIRLGLDRGEDWEELVILETAKVRAATSDVMSAYQIPADRSADLRR